MSFIEKCGLFRNPFFTTEYLNCMYLKGLRTYVSGHERIYLDLWTDQKKEN